MQQAVELYEEGEELKKVLETISPEDWNRKTPFKKWTINNVIQHLHGADKAAMLSLADRAKFLTIKYNLKAQRIVMSPKIYGLELLE